VQMSTLGQCLKNERKFHSLHCKKKCQVLIKSCELVNLHILKLLKIIRRLLFLSVLKKPTLLLEHSQETYVQFLCGQ
jgi:hypothetical protein